MNEVDTLRQYGVQTAPSKDLHVDVAADVMDTIRKRAVIRGESATALRPLMMLAAASWLIAIFCGVLAQQSFAAFDDPLSPLVAPFLAALQ